MAYIEIYPIENCARKIDDQLDVVLNEQPRMYNKTKKRYYNLAVSLLQSVEKIASILETDSLCCDMQEFDSEMPDTDIDVLRSAVQNAGVQVGRLASFVNQSSDIDSPNRKTLSRYAEILKAASLHSYSIDEATDCMQLIYKWFNARFLNRQSQVTFRYNIMQLPTWITNIIVLYGSYHSKGNIQVLKDKFDKWMCQISEGKNDKWAVPYEVHKLSKCSCSEFYTMESVIIGDVLMDEFLYQLTEEHSPGISCNLSCYPVASACRSHSPTLLPELQTRLANRDVLIDKYNLTERRKN